MAFPEIDEADNWRFIHDALNCIRMFTGIECQDGEDIPFAQKLAELRTEVDDLRSLAYVGALSGVREHYFALSTDKRIRHPALTKLVEEARSGLLGRTSQPARVGREG